MKPKTLVHSRKSHQPLSRPIQKRLYRKRDDEALLDAHALLMHQACLAKLTLQPELWHVLEQNLAVKQQQRFLKQAVFEKWAFILEGCQSIEQLAQEVLQLGRAGQRLRANSIFQNILTEQERAQLACGEWPFVIQPGHFSPQK